VKVKKPPRYFFDPEMTKSTKKIATRNKISFSYFEATSMVHYLVFLRRIGKFEKYLLFFVNFFPDYNEHQTKNINKDSQNKLIPPHSTCIRKPISWI
jgi:hypothetical protein